MLMLGANVFSDELIAGVVQGLRVRMTGGVGGNHWGSFPVSGAGPVAFPAGTVAVGSVSLGPSVERVDASSEPSAPTATPTNVHNGSGTLLFARMSVTPPARPNTEKSASEM